MLTGRGAGGAVGVLTDRAAAAHHPSFFALIGRARFRYWIVFVASFDGELSVPSLFMAVIAK